MFSLKVIHFLDFCGLVFYQTNHISVVNKNIGLGNYGEDLAVQYLQGLDWQILSRNWRCVSGEIDIVALDNQGTLVFCEVKTRSGYGFGSPLAAISKQKQEKIWEASRYWLAQYREANPGKFFPKLRFDAIGILAFPNGQTEIEHLDNAF